MIKAVIFDCFGVLFANSTNIFYANNIALFNYDSRGLDELNLRVDLGKIDRKQFVAELAELCGKSIEEVLEELDDDKTAPDSELVTIIRKLKSRYKIGLLSNASKEEISIVFTNGIDNLFDEQVISYEVGITKPSASIYRICAERLGVEPEECIFIDDSSKNIEAAKKLGMKTILYPTFGKIPEELKRLAEN